MYYVFEKLGMSVDDVTVEEQEEWMRSRQEIKEATEEIAQACDRDYYMTAPEAKEFGVVDDILSKPPASENDEDEDED